MVADSVNRHLLISARTQFKSHKSHSIRFVIHRLESKYFQKLPDLATDGSALAEEEGVRPRLVEATRKKAALGSQLTQFTRGKEESKLDSETDLFSLNSSLVGKTSVEDLW